MHDTESLDFATTCYRRLAAGGSPRRRPAGGAYGGRGEHGARAITWASYVHYGDPGYRPFPLGVDAQPSVPRATRKREPARFTVSLGGATGTPTVGRAAETPHLVGRADELASSTPRSPRPAPAPCGGRRERAAGDRQDGALEGSSPGCAAPMTCGSRRGGAIEQYGAGEAYLPLLARARTPGA